jgi:hypothetical protein
MPDRMLPHAIHKEKIIPNIPLSNKCLYIHREVDENKELYKILLSSEKVIEDRSKAIEIYMASQECDENYNIHDRPRCNIVNVKPKRNTKKIIKHSFYWFIKKLSKHAIKIGTIASLLNKLEYDEVYIDFYDNENENYFGNGHILKFISKKEKHILVMKFNQPINGLTEVINGLQKRKNNLTEDILNVIFNVVKSKYTEEMDLFGEILIIVNHFIDDVIETFSLNNSSIINS